MPVTDLSLAGPASSSATIETLPLTHCFMKILPRQQAALNPVQKS
jgi:hypothetical protein